MPEKLICAIEKLHKESKTGRLFAYCEADSDSDYNIAAPPEAPAELDFVNGELLRCRFIERRGAAALEALAGRQIERTKFFPALTIDRDQSDDLPPLAALLETLRGGSEG